MSKGRNHRFHAWTTGVSGRIFGTNIEPQAASALAPYGGFGRAKHSNYSLHRYLTYESVKTKVSGYFDGKSYITTAKGRLTGLDVGSRLHIHESSFSLMSARPEDDAPTVFTLSDLNMAAAVDGRPLTLTSLFPGGTFTTARLSEELKHEPLGDKPRVIPLYRIQAPPGDDYSTDGENVLHVRGFGSIALGQLVVSHDEWSVLMLHVRIDGRRGAHNWGDGDEMGALSGGTQGGTTDPPVK